MGLANLDPKTLALVERSRVYDLIRTGELPSVKIGRVRRVPADAVRLFVAQLTDSGLGHSQVSITMDLYSHSCRALCGRPPRPRIGPLVAVSDAGQ
jgi:excisionase family DNA binding protein